MSGQAGRFRSAWRILLESLRHDLRIGARGLLRSPGFLITAVVTLALATGATTAIFSLVDAVLLRPLPYHEPDRLVQVFGRAWREDRAGTEPDPVDGPLAPTDIDEFSRRSRTLDGLVGYTLVTRNLQTPGGPQRVAAVAADSNLFRVLGARPRAGRTFEPGDPPDVVVVSERLWRERSGSDRFTPGTAIRLDGRSYTILGVMPERFQFPYRAASILPGALPEVRSEAWLPIESRRGRLYVIARLRDGIRLEAAAAELSAVAARIEASTYAGTPGRVAARIIPLMDEVVLPVRRSIRLLFAAVGLVLIAACANVANLMLARLFSRAREIAVRSALGAGRTRIVRQLILESLLLSLAGGVAGLAVAAAGSRLLVTLAASRIPRADAIALDWRAFAFLLAICVTTALLFGLAPGIAASRTNPQLTLREGGTVTAGRRFGRVRDSLVLAEIALAFVLGLGAALIVREITRLRDVDDGMDTAGVLTMHLTPRVDAQDYLAIEDAVRSVPGVTAAGFTQLLPLQNWGWEADFAIEGRPSVGRPIAGLRYVTAGYFETLGIPIVEGRAFDTQDAADAPPVVLVNHALVRRYLGGGSAVGRRLDRGTIVGVVGDVRQIGLDRPAEPELYYPITQNLTSAGDIGMTLVVRAASRADAVAGPVRDVIHALQPGLAIFNVRSMQRVIDDSLADWILYRWSIGLFAALALGLACLGIYGVTSFNVAARSRELGVRLALGSGPARLARLVLARGARLGAAGIAIGFVLASSVALLLRHELADIGVRPAPILPVAALLFAFALLACLAPALRAARHDLSILLRHD